MTRYENFRKDAGKIRKFFVVLTMATFANFVPVAPTLKCFLAAVIVASESEVALDKSI